jgi:hypothetical protein
MVLEKQKELNVYLTTLKALLEKNNEPVAEMPDFNEPTIVHAEVIPRTEEEKEAQLEKALAKGNLL